MNKNTDFAWTNKGKVIIIEAKLAQAMVWVPVSEGGMPENKRLLVKIFKLGFSNDWQEGIYHGQGTWEVFDMKMINNLWNVTHYCIPTLPEAQE